MSRKTIFVIGAGILVGIGFGLGVELYRLHKRILEELVAIREQGER
jgi:hypothetical protein